MAWVWSVLAFLLYMGAPGKNKMEGVFGLVLNLEEESCVTVNILCVCDLLTVGWVLNGMGHHLQEAPRKADV